MAHAKAARDILDTRAEAMAAYDLPPYPCDRGYWWFRIRDALGLTRKPPPS